MTDVLRIAAAGIVIAVAAFLLREMGWRGAVAFSLFGLAAFLSFMAEGLSEVGGGVGRVARAAGVSEIAKEILKVVGVSYIFGIASDVCAEFGEKTLSSALVAVGRIEILLIALPYFVKITEAAASLVSG